MIESSSEFDCDIKNWFNPINFKIKEWIIKPIKTRNKSKIGIANVFYKVVNEDNEYDTITHPVIIKIIESKESIFEMVYESTTNVLLELGFEDNTMEFMVYTAKHKDELLDIPFLSELVKRQNDVPVIIATLS